MSGLIRDDGSYVDAEELDPGMVDALAEDNRRRILQEIGEEKAYPGEVAEALDMERQKTYYHFRILQESGLIEQVDEEKISGGSARYFSVKHPALVFDFGFQGGDLKTRENPRAAAFLEEPMESGYRIVVGSPDQHGPERVEAKDGHLAGEIGAKLGEYIPEDSRTVFLDTDVSFQEGLKGNLFVIGGVLTNTLCRELNGEFPVKFEEEDFPYRGLETPDDSYTEARIGFISKTENPWDEDSAVYTVAGIRGSGTLAAALAFKDLENILKDYNGGDFYTVVRGLDLDGDGDVDDYEVIE